MNDLAVQKSVVGPDQGHVSHPIHNNHVDASGDVFDVLLELQQLFTKFGKDSSNDFANYKYVSLGKMLEEVNPELAKLRCILTTKTTFMCGEMTVTSTLRHLPSKTEIQFPFTTPWAEVKGQSNAQAAGSVITYGRRYNLSQMLNSTSSDNDAEDCYRRCLQMIKDAESIGDLKTAANYAKGSVKPYAFDAYKELHEKITLKKESLKAREQVKAIVEIVEEGGNDANND